MIEINYTYLNFFQPLYSNKHFYQFSKFMGMCACVCIIMIVCNLDTKDQVFTFNNMKNCCKLCKFIYVHKAIGRYEVYNIKILFKSYYDF